MPWCKTCSMSALTRSAAWRNRMTMPTKALSIVAAVLAALFAASCGALPDAPDADVDGVEAEGSDPLAEKADAVTLHYTTFPNFLLPTAKVQGPAKRVFKSAASFKSYFGIDAPGIDYGRNWIVFYTPGTGTTPLKDLRGWRA